MLVTEIQSLILDETFMKLSVEAMILSDKVHENMEGKGPVYKIYGTDDSSSNDALIAPEVLLDLDETNSEDYSMYTTYQDGRDQAIVAKKDGVCYGAFRSSHQPHWNNWTRKFDFRNIDACVKKKDTNSINDDKIECCSVRTGDLNAFQSQFADAFEADLRACVEECTQTSNMNVQEQNCLILTGHSQGGSIANIASIYFQDLNPVVIAFGHAPAIHMPCPLIDSTSIYHWINSKDVGGVRIFDPIPFITQSKADFVGHTLILDEEGFSSSIAYMGIDDSVFGSMHLDVSSIVHSRKNYLKALKNLNEKEEYPIQAYGFEDGTSCAQTDALCKSNRCQNGECKPKKEICESCSHDNDCIGETVCRFGGCALKYGMIDAGCPCERGDYCVTGRCEFQSWISLSRTCVEKERKGSFCNEHSDCQEDNCSWRYICT